MLKRTEGHFKGKNDFELFFQTWQHENSVGTLVITHGLSEHSECYHRLAEGLAAHGGSDRWDIYAWDLRGHGRSEGKRGLANDFRDYCQDLEIFYQLVKAKVGNRAKPTVLLGHSMGGLITLRTLIESAAVKPRAVCLSSPALGIAMPVPLIKDKASHFLAKVWPSLTLFNEVKYQRLSQDPEILPTYERDILRHDKISPKVYLGMLESFEFVFKNAKKITLPVLMQLSSKDPVVSRPRAEAFFAEIGSEYKKKLVYENSLHEIFNDIERERVYADLGGFLNELKGANREISP